MVTIEIPQTLISNLNEISELNTKAIETLNTFAERLSETLALLAEFAKRIILQLTEISHITRDLTESLNLTNTMHNPSIFNDPGPFVSNQESLGEVSYYSNLSDKILNSVVYFHILLLNLTSTLEDFKLNLECIDIIISIVLGLNSRETPSQIINFNGDINIQINCIEENVAPEIEAIQHFINEDTLQEL